MGRPFKTLTAPFAVLGKRSVCTRGFRNWVLAEFPITKYNLAYWRLIEFLVFSVFVDEDTMYTIIGQSDVFKIEHGRNPTENDLHNYNAEDFLLKAKSEVLPLLSWSSWVHSKRSRVVTQCWSAAHHMRINQELRLQLRFGTAIDKDDEPVYFDNGNIAGDKQGKAQARFADAEFAMAKREKASSAFNKQGYDIPPDVLEIDEYMNGLSSITFTKTIGENLEQAYEAASELQLKPFADTNSYSVGDLRREQYRKLRCIAVQPQPFYSFSEEARTLRLSSASDSVLSMRNEVKLAATQGWTVFDLKHCHLSIAAAKWPMPKTKQFLEDGGDVWKELCGALVVRFGDQDSKPFVKEALYTLLYGGSPSTVARRFTSFAEAYQIDVPEVPLAAFFGHWMIREIEEAKSNVLVECGNGHRPNAFGQSLSTRLDGFSNRTILANYMQSWELKLLHPAIQYAKANDQYVRITLWEHDGFSADFSRRAEQHTQGLIRVVNERAAELGIPTRLVVKQ